MGKKKKSKVNFTVNPPRSFVEHERMIKEAFTASGLGPEEEVEVLYGHGPVGHVTFPLDTIDADADRVLVDLAERLRTGPTRTEFLHTEVWLTAEGRDEAGGPNPEALDRPIEREPTSGA